MTSEFGGAHELTGYHRGIDLVGYEWNCAADDGRVIFAGMNSTAGFEVKILHDDGYFTRYLHNEASLLVRVGQRVKRGDRLGLLGDTGFVTGKHCHFEVIAPDGTTRINPREYIADGAPASTDSTPFTPATVSEDDMRIINIENEGIWFAAPGIKPVHIDKPEHVQLLKRYILASSTDDAKRETFNARERDILGLYLRGIKP